MLQLCSVFNGMLGAPQTSAACCGMRHSRHSPPSAEPELCCANACWLLSRTPGRPKCLPVCPFSGIPSRVSAGLSAGLPQRVGLCLEGLGEDVGCLTGQSVLLEGLACTCKGSIRWPARAQPRRYACHVAVTGWETRPV